MIVVTAEKLTDYGLAQRACQFTNHGHQQSNISLKTLYACEHSPCRTQLFWIEMCGIPNFVSVHFVRHKVGVEHFVQTMRTDRGGNDETNRLTPTNHAMLCNAQALINMARKRLCYKASRETRQAMVAVLEAIKPIDPDLARRMVPDCRYRGNICHEIKPCGYMRGVIHYKEL